MDMLTEDGMKQLAGWRRESEQLHQHQILNASSQLAILFGDFGSVIRRYSPNGTYASSLFSMGDVYLCVGARGDSYQLRWPSPLEDACEENTGLCRNASRELVIPITTPVGVVADLFVSLIVTTYPETRLPSD